MMKLRDQFKTDVEVPSVGLKLKNSSNGCRSTGKRNDLWQHSWREFSHSRDSFISDTSLSEDKSVQDDIAVASLCSQKAALVSAVFCLVLCQKQ